MADQLFITGINGATGEPLIPPVSIEEFAQATPIPGQSSPQPAEAGHHPASEDETRPSIAHGQFLGFSQDDLAVVLKVLQPGIVLSPSTPKIFQTGWAIVFPVSTPDNVRQALQPLIDHRTSQIGPSDPGKVMQLTLDISATSNVSDWFTHTLGTELAVPPDFTKVPQFILIVGDAQAVPFKFERTLSAMYCVGRIPFSFDSPDPYQQYVKSIIAYETAVAAANAKSVVYWAPTNGGNFATTQTHDSLVIPLATQPEGSPVAKQEGFMATCLGGSDATKKNLLEVLTGSNDSPQPSFLFASCHGLAFPNGDQRQLVAQGALLCDEWQDGEDPASDSSKYLAAADITDDAHVGGMIAFLFVCYSCGTPVKAYCPLETLPNPLATNELFSELPLRLLSHPNGAALAVIAHIDMVTGFTFDFPQNGDLLTRYRIALRSILSGEPIGSVKTTAFKDQIDSFSEMFAASEGDGPSLSDTERVGATCYVSDYFNFCVLGDPAAALRSDLIAIQQGGSGGS